MAATSGKPEKLRIPVRGKVQRKSTKTIPMIAPVKIRLGTSHRRKQR